MKDFQSAYPTPLIKLAKLSKNLNNEIYAKLEMLNPTGSHKDRESLEVIKRLNGSKEVVIASTGNAAISLSALALGENITVHVFISKYISRERLNLIKTFRPVLHIVDGNYEDAIRESEEFALKKGIKSANPGKNFNKIIGDSEIGKEIAEQLHDDIDYIVVPTNNGTLLSGIWLGIKNKVKPHMVAAISPYTKLMESIAGYHRFDGSELYKAINESSGTIVPVTDMEASIYAKVLANEGIFCELSSSASLAAVPKLHVKNKKIVVIITGNALKFISSYKKILWLK
jgi:threonine synthase